MFLLAYHYYRLITVHLPFIPNKQLINHLKVVYKHSLTFAWRYAHFSVKFKMDRYQLLWENCPMQGLEYFLCSCTFDKWGTWAGSETDESLVWLTCGGLARPPGKSVRLIKWCIQTKQTAFFRERCLRFNNTHMPNHIQFVSQINHPVTGSWH